jgi:predicted RNase H-like HicB family nuclease
MAQQYKYSMRLYWSDEDHLWLVEVRDLPGAMADGTTPEEAIAHAQEVIENWIEVAQIDGRPIPEPRPFMRNNDEPARAYPGHVR